MRLAQCYALLELSPRASLDEVKASYRQLAFKYHPDLNPDNAQAAQHFTRINEAYVHLKNHLESSGSNKRVYHAETIRQEEEARARNPRQKRASAFYTKQEEVLRDILNDPFAKQVFEDIFSKLKRGENPLSTPQEPIKAQNFELSWGQRALRLDLKQGLWATIKKWAALQLDDHQTMRLPARNLVPGTTLRVDIEHRFSPQPKTIDLTLPMDFVVGRPLRLKGQGRRLGPWRGDLYLRLLAH